MHRCQGLEDQVHSGCYLGTGVLATKELTVPMRLRRIGSAIAAWIHIDFIAVVPVQRSREIRLWSTREDRSRTPSDDGEEDLHSVEEEDEEEVPHPSQRSVCYISGDRIVCDTDVSHTRVTKTMTEIFQRNMHEHGYKWVNLSPTQIDGYFAEFQKFYRWEIDDGLMKRAFVQHRRMQYSKWINQLKKRFAPNKPLFIREDVWAQYIGGKRKRANDVVQQKVGGGWTGLGDVEALWGLSFVSWVDGGDGEGNEETTHLCGADEEDAFQGGV